MFPIHSLQFTLRLAMKNTRTTNSSQNHKKDITLLDYTRVQHLEVNECLILLLRQYKIPHITRAIIISTTIRILEDILLLLSINMALQHFSNKILRDTTTHSLTLTITSSSQFNNNTKGYPTCLNNIHSLKKFSK